MRILKVLILSFVFILTQHALTGQTLYWINKNGGVFNDPNNWSLDSGGSSDGIAPSYDTEVVFDTNSALESDDNIIFEPNTDYEVYNLTVDDPNLEFDFVMQGSSGNTTKISILGSLTLGENTPIVYENTTSINNNIWEFTGDDNHKINTHGHDLFHVQIFKENGKFSLFSDFYASQRIRMYGGTWEMNGFDVDTDGQLLIEDDEPASAPWTKVIETSGSQITCDEYFARFVYQSLTLLGPHVIKTKVFTGDPGGVYDQVDLLEYEPGLFNPIEDNNLDCVNCLFDQLSITDDEITRIGGGITVNELHIINPSNEIQINGGNSRPDYITLNSVTSPGFQDCYEMPSFKAVYTDVGEIRTEASSLFIEYVQMEDVSAVGSQMFTLSGGLVLGASTGWNLINELPPITFTWKKSVNDGTGWENPDNWVTTPSSPGCIPTAKDIVVIQEENNYDLLLPSNGTARCKDFYWYGENIYAVMSADIEVYGNLYLDTDYYFTGTSGFRMKGIGSGMTVESYSLIPKLVFEAPFGEYSLQSDLEVDNLLFYGVSFDTNDFDIDAKSWGVNITDYNEFYFGNSTIYVDGLFDLAANNGVDIIVDPGTSKIICKSFMSRAHHEFYDLELINVSNFTFENIFPPIANFFKFNNLTISGPGDVSTSSNIEVENLVLNENTTFEILAGSELIINNTIISNGIAPNQPMVKSNVNGVQAQISTPKNNFCVVGEVDIQDIMMDVNGVAHFPNANDVSNNVGIDFTPISTNQSLPLYWIGGSGNWAIKSNWSTLSGGCPTNYNPNNRPKLVFDENSIFEEETVTLYASTTTNFIEFIKLNETLNFDVRVSLTLDDMVIDNSWVRLQNEDITILNEMEVKNLSVLEVFSDNLDIKTFIPLGPDNLIIIRPDSNMLME